jgi:hypothetical protein
MIVRKSPYGWDQFKAWDFPTLWDSISQNHPSDHPVSYFMLAVIFFEATTFCKRDRAEAPSGYGVGFEQLEVKNPKKKEIYEWLGISTD